MKLLKRVLYFTFEMVEVAGRQLNGDTNIETSNNLADIFVYLKTITGKILFVIGRYVL